MVVWIWVCPHCAWEYRSPLKILGVSHRCPDFKNTALKPWVESPKAN